MSVSVDAVVVGAGPNGLAAALTLAEAGCSVRVFEADTTPGGGCRTADLTLPGFHHDVCSTIQALTQISPFFKKLDLEGLGVRVLQPDIPFAQPLDGGRAAVGHRDLERTADGLGARDGAAYRSLFGSLVNRADDLFPEVLGDLRHLPRHPALLARFGLRGLPPVSLLARTLFRGEQGRALLAGLGAHAMRRLSAPLTSAFAIVLGLSAHTAGWPVIEGGSGRLVDAMVDRLAALGVDVECGRHVTSLSELPSSSVTMLDVGPRQLLGLSGDRLPAAYERALTRFRYGPGVFKVDFALTEAVPWANPEVRRAGTVHVGGTLREISASEDAVARGRHSQEPYVLVVQPGVVDSTRAPRGAHTLWAYCHVPNGSTLDRSDVITSQIERFAPGFRDVVAATSTRTAAGYESYNANYVGGDINAGRAGIYQTVLGPASRWSRYRTPLDGVYLCSSSTPPGGGVHGMCGFNAAREALSRELAHASVASVR